MVHILCLSELDIDVPAAHPLLLSHSPINAGLGSSEQMAEFLTEVVVRYVR